MGGAVAAGAERPSDVGNEAVRQWAASLLLLTTMVQDCFSDNVPLPHVNVDLLAEVNSVLPGGSFSVLLRQDIDEGWHTYWRNPGDSGASPTVAWQVPEGVFVGDFSWPYPERIAYGPLMNFGYHDQVLLPFEIKVPEDFSEPSLSIQGEGTILVCADICIPEKVKLNLTLPVGRGDIDGETVELFAKARGLIPAAVDVVATVSYTHLTLPTKA